MSIYRVAVLVGSLRQDSYNRKLARALALLAPTEFSFQQLAIDDLPPYNQDDDARQAESVLRLKADIVASSALLFVTPEYNRSIPGVLKNAIDHASRPYGKSAWEGKPAGILGISVGAIGTALAQQHLRNILAYLNAPTMGQPEAFLQAKPDFFNADGSVGRDSQEFLQTWMDSYVAWVKNMSTDCPVPAALPKLPLVLGQSSPGLQIRVGFEMEFICPAPTPMLLSLSIHYTRAGDLIVPDLLSTDPPVAVGSYRDLFGNWCSRIVAPEGRLVLRTDALLHDSGLADAFVPTAEQWPVEALPEAVLVYLLGSRYCETDELSDLAWLQFGNGPTGWARVQAICDFVHQHIEFGYHHARSTRTALQAYREGQGVCRDYAHLAIALCRCLNIPARYCTGYLGDIRIPAVPAPMDFAAWFEVYLGGHWYTFDARNNTPRIGRVLMARGRDACDVALSNTFGPNTLQSFTVWAHEVGPQVPGHSGANG